MPKLIVPTTGVATIADSNTKSDAISFDRNVDKLQFVPPSGFTAADFSLEVSVDGSSFYPLGKTSYYEYISTHSRVYEFKSHGHRHYKLVSGTAQAGGDEFIVWGVIDGN